MLDCLLEQYDKELNLRAISGKHTTASSVEDRKVIMEELLDAEVFSYKKGRAHSCFRELQTNLVSKVKHQENTKVWMGKHLNVIRNTLIY